MKEAYKLADGRKIDGRRVVVDVERGRTVDNWWVAGQGGARAGARMCVRRRRRVQDRRLPRRVGP
eukprot:30504-Chlamydomonas_euryale.AAC.1